MNEKIIMPKLGMTMTEGTIEEWHKEVGDAVEKGEAILTISSEKLTQEVEAPISGILLSQDVETGDEVKVGEVVGTIGEVEGDIAEANGEEKEAVSEERVSSKENVEKVAKTEGERAKAKTLSNDRNRIFITPLARKMAEDKNLDIELVRGTGGNGRITKLDIKRVEEIGYDYEGENPSEQSAPPAMNVESIGEGLPSMRKIIARNMRESLAKSAQLTLHRKASANMLMAMQQKLREEIEEAELDIKITVTVLIARATILALQDYKKMNAIYHDGELIEYDEVHLGIATSLDEGLLVPVVKNAHHKTIGSLAKEIKAVSTQARGGDADVDLLSGSTFTITNMGATGVEYFTPILNAPESGILGVGALQEEFTLNSNQEVEMEKKIPFSLTFDHQILDGADAATFLEILIKYIESPNLLML
ncbi:dihydrolipoamide acetyltransferase family protein [Pseudogracilibacillus sp. SO30301A]|uniref:dihydrolipoamide acetyltransferase family protein n=1 Tax=Pseudogracilibacillus sp. SO30301A TaxID=3098291 RepID=UPI00300E6597